MASFTNLEYETNSHRPSSATSVISRVALGMLSDKVSPHILGAIAMACSSVCVLVLWGITCEFQILAGNSCYVPYIHLRLSRSNIPCALARLLLGSRPRCWRMDLSLQLNNPRRSQWAALIYSI